MFLKNIGCKTMMFVSVGVPVLHRLDFCKENPDLLVLPSQRAGLSMLTCLSGSIIRPLLLATQVAVHFLHSGAR